ncbi:MAG: TIGR02530 family flagellar biosynthesis protein [Candidatus Sericytochromatia bacterium]|nr:TIGR02530 family flagellar biosynthesis protein [Candidatus Sericytochromatia bacterium]
MDEVFLNQAIGPTGPLGPGVSSKPAAPSTGPSFGSVLSDKLAAPSLKLSAHAQQRLHSRQIQLDAQDWQRIHEGVERAAAKGAREALVFSEKAALVVSVRNRTVITAVAPAAMKENVFTHIDSAVIV